MPDERIENVERAARDWFRSRFPTNAAIYDAPDRDLKFDEIGMDSTDTIELIMHIEERTGLRFSPERLTGESVTLAALKVAFAPDSG